MIANKPWGWDTATPEELKEIHAKLSELERRTWSEILVKSAYQNHRVRVTQVCPDAQRRLDELGYGDLEHLVSLRLGATERVWGVLNEAVLTLLWWDPNHSVYPVQMKNT
ncbi:MAG: hypothetical protein JNL62_17595 [Bryobacterales bacterium]|nr:hypothetical protein [Bryobacterales bacterium]